MPQSTLILGGGIGGVVAANTLRRRLPREHRIILVDREPRFALAASFLWVMNGTRTEAQISRPLAGLSRKGIEVVRGEVERIDPERRSAVVDGRTLTADQLIVAIGAEFSPEVVPGLAESGHTFCTLGGAIGLRQALERFRRGRVVVLTAEPAYKCPAAPYEAAMLIDAEFRRRGTRNDVELILFSAEPGPMGVAGPVASAAVRAMVEQKRITYHSQHQIVRADGRRIEFSNGVSVEHDLLVYVPPIRPPRVLVDAGLSDSTGWVAVDRHTLETRFPGVYAVGDVTLIPLAMGKPLPRAGVFAHGQAEVVATNIARSITGKGRPERFEGHGACFIETGNGRAGFGSGNFYAEPAPKVRMRRPALFWHLGKVLFEKQVLWQWI